MTEAEWMASSDLWPMQKYLEETRSGSDRKWRLFACACCRRVWDLLDDVCRNAIETAERFADGMATADELRASRQAVWDGPEKQFPDFHPTPCGADFAEMSFFLRHILPNEPGWLAREDAEWLNSWGSDPVTIRAQRVRYYALEAVMQATSEHTWGRITTAGRAWCTAYASSDANFARVGIPTEDVDAYLARRVAESVVQAGLLKDVLGNPFRPVVVDPSCRTPAVVALAKCAHEESDFTVSEFLADALEDAGCNNPDILAHCRGPGPHVRGCWVVDLILGKQ
jgi:hypothetical protein